MVGKCGIVGSIPVDYGSKDQGLSLILTVSGANTFAVVQIHLQENMSIIPSIERE
jgi:hypothetical protein